MKGKKLLIAALVTGVELGLILSCLGCSVEDLAKERQDGLAPNTQVEMAQGSLEGQMEIDINEMDKDGEEGLQQDTNSPMVNADVEVPWKNNKWSFVALSEDGSFCQSIEELADTWTGTKGDGTELEFSLHAKVMIPRESKPVVAEGQRLEVDSAGKKHLLDNIFAEDKPDLGDYEKDDFSYNIWGNDYKVSFSELRPETFFEEYTNSKPGPKDYESYVDISVNDKTKLCPSSLANVPEEELFYGAISSDDTTRDAIWEEKLRTTAELALEGMGLGRVTCIGTNGLFWQRQDFGEGEDGIVDGLVFYFSPQIGEMKLLDFEMWENYGPVNYLSSRGWNCQHSEGSYYVVMINDKGIVQIYLNNPIWIEDEYEINHILAPEEAAAILKNTLEKDAANYENCLGNVYNKCVLNECKLVYIRVNSPEDNTHFSYIPVWRFNRNLQSQNESIGLPHHVETFYLVNAMDGTVIHPEDCF